MAVLGNNAETLLTGLSDFWQRFFSDKDVLQGLYSATEVQLGQAYLDMVTEVLNVNLRETPLFNREFWKLLTIRKDQVRANSDGDWAFDLPDGIAAFEFLTNRIYDPTVVLERGVDFSLDEETRQLLFTTNPFVPFFEGVPRREVEITPTIFQTGVDGQFNTGALRTFAVRGFIRDGEDGELPLPGTSDRFKSLSAEFTADDVNRELVFTYDGVTYDGEGGNPDPPVIIAVLNSEVVLLDTSITITASPATDLPWELRDTEVFVSTDIGDDLVLQDPFTPGLSYTVEITAVDAGGLSVTVDQDILIPANSDGVLWTHQSKPRVPQYAFWVPDAFVDRENLYLSFGYLVDRYEVSSESYRALLEGIFRYFILGPTLGRTEAALNVMSGVPVVREDEEVVTDFDVSDDDFDLVITSKRSYEVPKGSIKDELAVGDELQAFQSLTNIFTVSDHVSDPNWYLGQVIPEELVEDESAARRNVDPTLYENQIGNPRWYIGDPGFYIGADDTRFVPTDKAGLDGLRSSDFDGTKLVSHLQKFFDYEVGQTITVEGETFTILSVDTAPEPHAQLDGDLTSIFNNLVFSASPPEPGNTRIQLSGDPLTSADEGRLVQVGGGDLAGQSFIIDQVLSADIATLADITTGDPIAPLSSGDVTFVTLGATWEIDARPALRHTTGYLFMRDFLKQHVFTVSYDLASFPDIPFPRLDDDIRDVLLEGKPAYVTMFFNPNNFFLDEVAIEDSLAFTGTASFSEEMEEVGGTLTIGSGWDIGDYYYYGYPTVAWIDFLRGTDLDDPGGGFPIVEFPEVASQDQLVLSGFFVGGTDPEMLVVLYFIDSNGDPQLTGESAVLDEDGVNLATFDVNGLQLAAHVEISGSPDQYGLNYGYLTDGPATVILSEETGYPESAGGVLEGSNTFEDSTFEFLPEDNGRQITAVIDGEVNRYWVTAVRSSTQVDLLHSEQHAVPSFSAESDIDWRLGPLRRVATSVIIGGQDPVVPHPDEGPAESSHLLDWPFRWIFRKTADGVPESYYYEYLRAQVNGENVYAHYEFDDGGSNTIVVDSSIWDRDGAYPLDDLGSGVDPRYTFGLDPLVQDTGTTVEMDSGGDGNAITLGGGLFTSEDDRWNFIPETGVFTVSVWIVWDQVGGGGRGSLLSSKKVDANQAGLLIDCDDLAGTNLVRAIFSDGTTNFEATSNDDALFFDVISHLVVTGDGSTMRLFIDGTEHDSVGISLASSGAGGTRSLIVGDRHDDIDPTGFLWQGQIDALSFLDTDLSSSQISALYESARDPAVATILALAPTHFWLFDRVAYEGTQLLFSDEAGTTPLTGTGRVGRAVDLVGGVAASNSNGGVRRPVFTGARLAFSGTDQTFLDATTSFGNVSGSLSWGSRHQINGNDQRVFGDLNMLLGTSAGGGHGVLSGSGGSFLVVDSAANNDGVERRWVANDLGAATEVFQDGVSAASGNTGTQDSTSFAFGRTSTGSASRWLDGTISAWVIFDRVLSGEEVVTLDAALNALSGGPT